MFKLFIDKFIDILTDYLTGNEEMSRALILALIAFSVLISGYVVFADASSKRHYITFEEMTPWEREIAELGESS